MTHHSPECGDGICMCYRYPLEWKLAHLWCERPRNRRVWWVKTRLIAAFGVHARDVVWKLPREWMNPERSYYDVEY